MATATTFKVTPADVGIFNVGVNPDSAPVASKALQENMEKFHIYFNDQGFHSKSILRFPWSSLRRSCNTNPHSLDHAVHYILTRYALGCPPEEIQKAYDQSAEYQRVRKPADEGVVKAMADRTKFKGFLGDEKQYSNFLAYFQREIDEKGVGDTVNEHLFAGDEHADDMLARLFAG